MQQFEIEIPNPKRRVYRFISLMIAGMNLLSFALAASRMGEEKAIGWIGLGILINLLLIILLLLKKKWPVLTWIQPVWVFFLSSLIWFYQEAYWIAISLLAFSMMGIFSQRKNLIQINHEGLRYPSFPVKEYSWNAVEQVLLKDGVLSLDLEGNRFLQFSLPEASLQKIDENKFNRFCAEKIHAHKSGPTKISN